MLERRGDIRLGPGVGIGLGGLSDDDIGGSSDSEDDLQQQLGDIGGHDAPAAIV